MSLETQQAIRGRGRTMWVRPPLDQPRSNAIAFARVATVAGALLLFAGPALAASSGGDPMPWEGPMDRFLEFFTGPFVRIAAIIAIVLLGVGMAFSENGTGMRKMTTGFFGICLAFGAATWGLSFFGFSGGASIGVPAETIVEEQLRFDAEASTETSVEVVIPADFDEAAS